MNMPYEQYVARINAFLIELEDEGFEIGYHDDRRAHIAVIPPFDAVANREMDMDNIQDIAEDIVGVGWIRDMSIMGRDEILIKYSDLYL